jgi:nucleotide-binding universal stress UspA family protein
MAEKILVGIDGSESAREATDYACCLARQLGMEVIALRVVDKRKYLPGFWHGIEKTIEKELEAHAVQTLREARAQGKTYGLAVELEIRYGDSAEEICRFARDRDDIVLVVLGASGRGHHDKQVLGYTAEHVAFQVGKKLPCPVILVPYRGMSEDAGRRHDLWCRRPAGTDDTVEGA